MSILGNRVVRTEDPHLLTGGGSYVANLEREGILEVAFALSPVAHGLIRGIDTEAALALDGVEAVLTAADIELPPLPAAAPERIDASRPLLATGRVRFAGEPVAMVIARTAAIAEDAANLVWADIEPLPALVDPEEAATSGIRLFEGSNVVLEREPAGDPGLFDGAAVVVTQRIVNQRVAPAPMETRGAAAVWGDDGRLTAWVPNQGAQLTRLVLASMLGVDSATVRVITPDVGGAFGAKFGADPEHAIVCWVAGRLRRPARWTETRNENMIAMTHGRAQIQAVTIGGDRDGRVRAYRLEIIQDSGAYPRIGVVLPSLTVMMAPGPYSIERAEAAAISVVTSTTPVGAYRGAGRPEATAALERAMDLFAASAGLDPAEVRRANLLPPFAEPHATAFGARYDSGDYVAALDRALAAAGYADLREEQARRREAGDPVCLGIGLACYVEVTGGGMEAGNPSENARVEVHPDGTATILTGTSPHGQGHATVWAMLASDELGIGVDKITVRWGDTDLIPEGGGTGGSRSLQQGGVAVRQASRELLDEARQRAAAELEASPDDLVFDVSRSAFTVVGDPEAAVSLARLAEGEPLAVRTVFEAPGATFPFGTHVAVVDVDTETGKVTLRRVVTVDDAGVVINPLLAEGQRHGGIAQGAAQALCEEVVYDAQGNPLTARFADYPIVSATELPSFELAEMATPTSYNPLGAKGLGEAGTIGATPAVQNAVVDALSHLGVRHIDMPASPRRVWRALREAAAEREASPEAAAQGSAR